MENEKQGMLGPLEDILDRLLSGERCGEIDASGHPPEAAGVIVRLNRLIGRLEEVNGLASALAEGRLDCAVPPRGNYMAAPLKRLHSQLCILTQSCRQLQSGQVTGKLEYTGELFEVFNGLIERMGDMMVQKGHDDSASGGTCASVNSWRYHQLLQVLNLLHIGVLETDSWGRVMYANRPAKSLLGEISHIRREETRGNILLELIEGAGRGHTFPVLQETCGEDDHTWYRITSDRFSLPDEQSFYLHILEDITDWKRSESSLRKSAETDGMTGTLNRRMGMEELERLLSKRELSQSYALAFIDIDGLKPINDIYGHSEGDYAIKTIARTLLSCVRESDLVCRYGGDEFFIVFQNATREIAESVLGRMNKKLGELNESGVKPYPLSFSYGLEVFTLGHGRCASAAQLLEVADQRMYVQKTRKKQAAREEE